MRNLGKKKKVKYHEVYTDSEDEGSSYDPDQSPDQSPVPSPDQVPAPSSDESGGEQESVEQSSRVSNADYQRRYRRRKLRGPDAARFKQKEADRMKAYRQKDKSPEMRERIKEQNRARLVQL